MEKKYIHRLLSYLRNDSAGRCSLDVADEQIKQERLLYKVLWIFIVTLTSAKASEWKKDGEIVKLLK